MATLAEIGRGTAAVQNAVEAGRLTPVSDQRCADCGREAQAYHHHHGYEPEHLLDVVALCDRCHGRRHAALRPKRERAPKVPVPAKLLRFPPTLAEAIQQEAARGRRSFSAQVFLMLELAIKRGG
jgi:hypothetical protein